MVDTAKPSEPMAASGDARWDTPTAYHQWMEAQGIPIHRGYFVPDGRTVELSWWEARQCNAAFLLLAGLEGVSEIRVTEIPPGKSLPPTCFGMDEVAYVLDGRGLTTLTWADGSKHTFEWGKTSLFRLPRNCTYELSNAQGNQPARILTNNYLPLAMATTGDAEPFFKSPFSGNAMPPPEAEVLSEAKAVHQPLDDGGVGAGVFWYGNFFPNMATWDHLSPFTTRGAGGHVVWIRFPQSPLTAHMSVFPAQTYKKAHRHGAGWVLVIPKGEGYSVMWPEGQEKVIVPWHEGTIFVPPNRWFHQHFNLGSEPARYVALHPPMFLSGFSEKIEDMERDQIEYPNEDPMIRQRFEEELAKRGLTSLMPADAYGDRQYQWNYAGSRA
ncbi:MAG TPA: cupin domain-containing protein [Chloroflexota bacterium]|nr:cupin domain-containing protein [Chloroflexota bacterium]